MFKKLFTAYRQAFSGLPRAAWLFAMAEFVNRSGTMVLFFLILYLTQVLGFSIPQAGLVMGAFGVGALVGAWAGGALCDRMGAVQVQKASLIGAGVLFFVISLLRDYPTLVGFMFVLGIFEEALHPSGATALTSACPAELRTRGFALHRLATNLGVTIGPAVGGFLAMVDYRLLFWVDGATCLFAGAMLHIFFPGKGTLREHAPAAEGQAGRSLWRDPVFIPIALLLFGLATVFCQIFNTFPLYLRTAYGFPESFIGRLIAVNTLLIIAVEMALTKALETRPPLPLVALGVLLVGSGFSLMPLGSGFLFAAGTVVVWTVGEILSMPFFMGWVANRASDSTRGAYMGMVSFCFSLGMTAAGPAGTWAYAFLRPARFWAVVGVVSAVLAAGFLLLHQKTHSSTPQPPAAEQ